MYDYAGHPVNLPGFAEVTLYNGRHLAYTRFDGIPRTSQVDFPNWETPQRFLRVQLMDTNYRNSHPNDVEYDYNNEHPSNDENCFIDQNMTRSTRDALTIELVFQTFPPLR